MILRGAVVALCLFAFGCGGSDTMPPSPTPTSTTFALNGRVTDADTNLPIVGATVTILDGKNANTTTATDAAGTFRLTGLTMGGFTVRVRANGYDSALQGVTLVTDTSIAISMKAANKTLSGTWTGVVSFTPSTGTRQDAAVPQLTVAQSGAGISSTFNTSSSLQGRFNGTLSNVASIDSTTAVTGTMTLTIDLAGRGPTTCTGAVAFTGSVNWTQMMLAAPRVVFECGTVYSDVTMSFTRQQ
jgi:hypothetical protein